jgi:hypothetical protein
MQLLIIPFSLVKAFNDRLTTNRKSSSVGDEPDLGRKNHAPIEIIVSGNAPDYCFNNLRGGLCIDPPVIPASNDMSAGRTTPPDLFLDSWRRYEESYVSSGRGCWSGCQPDHFSRGQSVINPGIRRCAIKAIAFYDDNHRPHSDIHWRGQLHGIGSRNPIPNHGRCDLGGQRHCDGVNFGGGRQCLSHFRLGFCRFQLYGAGDCQHFEAQCGDLECDVVKQRKFCCSNFGNRFFLVPY